MRRPEKRFTSTPSRLVRLAPPRPLSRPISEHHDKIAKPAALMALSDLLSDRMEARTLHDTAAVLFDTYDNGRIGVIGLEAFLGIHDRLLEMAR